MLACIRKDSHRIFTENHFEFTRIGSWWYGGDEMDMVALNATTKEILFCKCKYTNRMLDTDVYPNLVDKSGYVKWEGSEREEIHCLISKSGFTKRMKKLAANDNVPLLDINDLEMEFIGGNGEVPNQIALIGQHIYHQIQTNSYEPVYATYDHKSNTHGISRRRSRCRGRN